jgi:hypothetical protein
MPPDPYERLQAARRAVKALQDERSALAVRLAELARVALDALAAAAAGADWRSLEQARQARADAAAAVGPAWEALRWAGLRVARAEYELDRLVEQRLATGGRPQP